MTGIVNFIDHFESPIIDGVVFADERIQLLDIDVNYASQRMYTYKITKAAETTIKDLEKEGNLYWSSCAVMAEEIDSDHSIKAIAGEASFGGDGFVAVLQLESEKLIWLAFFQDSNPFKQVNIIADEIHALSTHDYTWKFKMSDPTEVSVQMSRDCQH